MRPNLLLSVGALAAVASSQTFEVASVKPAAPPSFGNMMAQVRGCRPDPVGMNCTGTTLRELLAEAYGVKLYQVDGPAWLGADGYDIVAKMPEGAPPGQKPAMIQALLADRFKVTLHRETRTLPVYELSIAKGGPKMKELDAAALAAPPPPPRRDPTAPPPPPPPPGGGPAPTFRMMFGTNGSSIVGRVTMPQLVQAISRAVDHPVLDVTGLPGPYDIDLKYMPEESSPMASQIRQVASMAAQGGVDVRPPEATAPAPTIFAALQQTLGLKLESKKSPVEVLVVDAANKVPTEN